MHDTTRNIRKPNIRISKTDHARLSILADTFAHRNAESYEELLAELDRARIVHDNALSIDVVRMGSQVSFATDTGETRTVTLVFPGEADIAAGRISVLTPIGTALIGLAQGQSIQWTARDGRRHELSVLNVGQASQDAGAHRQPSSAEPLPATA